MNILRILTAAAISASLLGCTTIFNGGPNVGVSRLGDGSTSIPAGTDPSDQVVGQREHPKIVATYGGSYADRSSEIMIARLAGKLLVAAGEGNSKLTVTILDSEEVNAFALPGGYIYVTRGILALANDEAELAAVLAHEIAHLTLRHARERSNRERTSKIVDRVVGGFLGSNPETDQSAARSKLSLAAFSQAQELAADKEGVKIAGQAGYDPHAAARFLGLMGQFAAFKSKETTGDDFLSSHPSTPDRIELAVKAARGFGAPGIGANERARYLRAIDGIAFGPNPNNGTIAGQHFLHPNLGFIFSTPKRYALSNGNSSVVAVAKDGTAARFDSVFVPVEVSLVDYISSGWVAGLDETSIKKTRVNNIDMATAAARTKDWAFEVAVLRFDDQVYRFIFAAKSAGARLSSDFKSTLKSFRKIRTADLKQIRKYEISVLAARPGQTSKDFVAQMKGVSQSAALFNVLNGLLPGDQLVAGQGYKIVVPK
ncbi:M48 family metalloprotease [Maritalea sp.]|uniref:M48 family metalloprotease n=1 Tax=Maritalea sp. TaxID=2003361 RepID=UPI003EF32025